MKRAVTGLNTHHSGNAKKHTNTCMQYVHNTTYLNVENLQATARSGTHVTHRDMQYCIYDFVERGGGGGGGGIGLRYNEGGQT